MEYRGEILPGDAHQSLGPQKVKKKKNKRKNEAKDKGKDSGVEEQSSLTVNGVMKEGGHRSRRSSEPRADLQICSVEAEMRSCESCNHPARTSSHPLDETAKDLQTELVIYTGPRQHTRNSPTNR